MAGILHDVLVESRSHLADRLRHLGRTTREGLSHLEPSGFISDFNAAFEQTQPVDPLPLNWYRRAFATVLAENWSKSLVYKVFVILGGLLWLGILLAVSIGIYKARLHHTTAAAGNILFVTVIVSSLGVPIVLSLFAWTLRMFLIGLGSALQVMAGAIVALLIFGLVPLIEHFWAEKVLHAARRNPHMTTFLDLGPEMAVTFSRQQIEKIERIELQETNGGVLVCVLLDGGCMVRSGTLPRERAEELRTRIHTTIEAFLAHEH
ncbi:MAG TPA: hypothetical protein VKU02_28925 [Gemmataceae bacterium]|nr:hypothetical protein [Gemmataceae bacterium]